MRTFDGIDAIRAEIGSHIGYSDWHRVTQQVVDTFAEVTRDRQWIHVDPVAAAKGPFGTTIAHGYLSLSLITALQAEVYEVAGIGMRINYGSDRVRHPAPLLVGSRVRAGVELLSLEPASLGFQLTARIGVESDHGAKPVCVADTLTLLVPA